MPFLLWNRNAFYCLYKSFTRPYCEPDESTHSVICFNIILFCVPKSWVVSSFLVSQSTFLCMPHCLVFAIGTARPSLCLLILYLICSIRSFAITFVYIDLNMYTLYSGTFIQSVSSSWGEGLHFTHTALGKNAVLLILI